ncbi:MAG: DUF4097 family beta strand repeat-containing protein [Longimicrobiales bacterium]
MLETLILSLAFAAAPLPQQQTDTTFAVEPDGRLDVENHNGHIRVRSWDRDAVRIQAQHPARTELDIDSRGSVVRVEADARGQVNVEYEITVPRSFAVTIETLNGNIGLEDIGGEVGAETMNGSIALRGGTGRIDLESVSGEIVIDGARGTIDAATVNEGVSVTRSSGDITAETVNGSIMLTDIESSNVDAETVNGRVHYAGTIRDGGRYALMSHNGNLTITIPEGTNASVSATTHNGAIETDFAVEVRGVSSDRRLSFTLGNGSARIELETFGGSIGLVRPGGR